LENWRNLRPTPEQYRAFAEYLPAAHSRYTHLPLLTGRRFIVFVAADAGIGRLVGRRGIASRAAPRRGVWQQRGYVL